MIERELRGQSVLSKEGKWWKFCNKASDGSGFYWSQGFDTKEEAEQAMKEHDTCTGRYWWRSYGAQGEVA